MAENGNDADKRPRVYAKATGEKGSVEVTVRGSEGETSDDVMGHLDDAMATAENAQEGLDDESYGVGFE